MKPHMKACFLIGLFILALLTGCMRNRLVNPAGLPAATNPPAPTQAAPLPTATSGESQGVTPVQQPTLTTAPAQPQATDTAQAMQATATASAAASQDFSKAADDLSKMLDDLTKDLNSADNLNDLK